MKQGTFGARVLRFYTSLRSPGMPRGIEVMNPYADAGGRKYVRAFLGKYFDDNRQRTLILGINPGRFGAGMTGVTFTDPIALTDACGIPNDLPRRPELSATFIYQLITRLGGPRTFYGSFFLSAICPLGFTRRGVNLNYYDDKRLTDAVGPFIVKSIERHLALGGRDDQVVVLGRGKNAIYLEKLNERHRWFGKIHALDHPRFIMQYRRKQLDRYLAQYAKVLKSVHS